MSESKICANPLVVIGGQKCGTATLVADLECCKSLAINKDEKESSPLLYLSSGGGQKNLLNKLLSPSDCTRIKVDVSTRYSCFPEVVVPFGEIKRRLPNAKFVYIVRNPYERTLSHHHHDTVLGITRGKAIDDITPDSPYIQNSKYGQQLKLWIDAFGVDKILLIKFEDYISNRKETVSRICAFSGVHDDGVEDIVLDKAENVTSDRPKFPVIVAVLIRSQVYVSLVKIIFPVKVRRFLKSILGKQHEIARPKLPKELRMHIEKGFLEDQKLLQNIYPNAPKWKSDI